MHTPQPAGWLGCASCRVQVGRSSTYWLPHPSSAQSFDSFTESTRCYHCRPERGTMPSFAQGGLVSTLLGLWGWLLSWLPFSSGREDDPGGRLTGPTGTRTAYGACPLAWCLSALPAPAPGGMAALQPLVGGHAASQLGRQDRWEHCCGVE